MNLKHFLLGFVVAIVIATNAEAKFKDASIDAVKAAAEQGDAQAQAELGLRYFFGDKGVYLNYETAASWFSKAAEQGDAKAQMYLGNCYFTGGGVKQDSTQAVYWYRKAAEQGVADAQYLLGLYYHTGEGVKQDTTQAAYWWRKAAEQGDQKALDLLLNLDL